ncbi:MAG: OmpH family outer membrane protein [Rikenellaceae bacterium]|nr:OmpH family outer membrane protein [Rikenellaceae bacterium]
MKKILFALMITSLLSVSGYAQKYGYVYSEKIFKAIPEYEQALKSVESYAKQGQEHVKSLYEEAQKTYDGLRSVQSRLTQDQFEALAKASVEKEREATKYNEEFFGKDGKLAKYQQSLMKPIEDRVVAAVEAEASESGYDMIFDLSVVKFTVYQSPTLDLTEKVIARLGIE